MSSYLAETLSNLEKKKQDGRVDKIQRLPSSLTGSPIVEAAPVQKNDGLTRDDLVAKLQAATNPIDRYLLAEAINKMDDAKAAVEWLAVGK